MTRELTWENEEMYLQVAVSYSGTSDIARVAKQLAREAKEGVLDPDTIDESLIASRLETGTLHELGLGCPDMVIRTSGEERLSNFLTWESAYSELYFTEKPWPAFSVDDLQLALNHYVKRKRRFGR